MVTMETPTRNFVLGRKVLDTGFFHPIPVSDDIVPVNLGKQAELGVPHSEIQVELN